MNKRIKLLLALIPILLFTAVWYWYIGPKHIPTAGEYYCSELGASLCFYSKAGAQLSLTNGKTVTMVQKFSGDYIWFEQDESGAYSAYNRYGANVSSVCRWIKPLDIVLFTVYNNHDDPEISGTYFFLRVKD